MCVSGLVLFFWDISWYIDIFVGLTSQSCWLKHQPRKGTLVDWFISFFYYWGWFSKPWYPAVFLVFQHSQPWIIGRFIKFNPWVSCQKHGKITLNHQRKRCAIFLWISHKLTMDFPVGFLLFFGNEFSTSSRGMDYNDIQSQKILGEAKPWVGESARGSSPARNG